MDDCVRIYMHIKLVHVEKNCLGYVGRRKPVILCVYTIVERGRWVRQADSQKGSHGNCSKWDTLELRTPIQFGAKVGPWWDSCTSILKLLIRRSSLLLFHLK